MGTTPESLPRQAVTRVGRAPDNDVVISGPQSATVSLYHCEIVRDGAEVRVRDLGSTNGTWVNGVRVTEATIGPADVVRLGQQGPAVPLNAPLDRTIEMPPVAGRTHEELLSAAVHHARTMRAHGLGGETMTIMKDVLDRALRHSVRRHRTAGYALALALLAVSGLGAWRITVLDRQKSAIDGQIRGLESQLQKAKGADADRLLSRLDDAEDQAESLQHSLLYRISPHDEGDFVTRELRDVMAEFGAEAYSIPPDFVARVNHYIQQDTGPDRPLVEHALVESADRIKTIRGILSDQRMPKDLAYIPIVESALTTHSESAAGAVGPWQMTAATARAYGLKVEDGTDERLDLVKSTQASCRYLKDLILDFGAGSSVMLALAAYNSGTGKVKAAVARAVHDPIRQRNFWYLYRAGALPNETLEYVPKVFAAILIGRNPRHFGL